MDPEIILAHLNALLQRQPDFDEFSPSSMEHQKWLAKAHAFIKLHDNYEAISFKSACNTLAIQSVRQMNLNNIFGAIYMVIAELESQIPSESQVIINPGDEYKFFTKLNSIISSAEKSILIADTWMDQSIFDHYLDSRKNNVTVRLLIKMNEGKVKHAAEKYKKSYGDIIDVRKSKKFHDRVVFVDDEVCWLIGQSLKDAGTKPTYIVELSPDLVSDKLEAYETVWNEADSI